PSRWRILGHLETQNGRSVYSRLFPKFRAKRRIAVAVSLIFGPACFVLRFLAAILEPFQSLSAMSPSTAAKPLSETLFGAAQTHALPARISASPQEHRPSSAQHSKQASSLHRPLDHSPPGPKMLVASAC